MSESESIRWSLVGAGTAGMARARAISADRRSTLASVWRGRNAERLIGATLVHSLEEAIKAADAVAICSPDAVHATQVEAALLAGRHVVCEYPLASDIPTARRLFELARQADRVLHVAHIELLHAPQAMVRSHTRTDPVETLTQHFSRTGAEDVPAAEVVRRNLARVHRMVDLCGPVVDLLEIQLEPGRVQGRIEHAQGAESHFVWNQSPYLKRATRMVIGTASGESWTLTADTLVRDGAPQTLVESAPLFHQDHGRAMGRILDGRPGYLDEERLLHCLLVLERIASGSEGPVEST